MSDGTKGEARIARYGQDWHSVSKGVFGAWLDKTKINIIVIASTNCQFVQSWIPIWTLRIWSPFIKHNFIIYSYPSRSHFYRSTRLIRLWYSYSWSINFDKYITFIYNTPWQKRTVAKKTRLGRKIPPFSKLASLCVFLLLFSCKRYLLASEACMWKISQEKHTTRFSAHFPDLPRLFFRNWNPRKLSAAFQWRTFMLLTQLRASCEPGAFVWVCLSQICCTWMWNSFASDWRFKIRRMTNFRD